MSETNKETENTIQEQPQTEVVEETEAVKKTQSKASSKTETKKSAITRIDGTEKMPAKAAGYSNRTSKPLSETKKGKFTRTDY